MHLAVDDDVHDGACGFWGGWNQHRIDDVHYAVVGNKVRHGHLGVVDEDAGLVDGDRYLSTVECGDGLAVGSDRC